MRGWNPQLRHRLINVARGQNPPTLAPVEMGGRTDTPTVGPPSCPPEMPGETPVCVHRTSRPGLRRDFLGRACGSPFLSPLTDVAQTLVCEETEKPTKPTKPRNGPTDPRLQSVKTRGPRIKEAGEPMD